MTAAALLRAAATTPGRASRGRPARITARAAIAAAIATVTAVLIGGTPAAPADITAAALWLALTSRAELAPPPLQRGRRQ